MSGWRGGIAGILATALAAAAGPAPAQSPLPIVVATRAPLASPAGRLLRETFAAAVDKALKEAGIAAAWTFFDTDPRGQPLGVFEALDGGRADLGVVHAALLPDRLPLLALTNLTPFVTTPPGGVLAAMDRLAGEYTAVQAQWEKFDLVPLGGSLGFEEPVLATRKPVVRLADLEGLRIGVAAPADVGWLEGTGAVGVAGPIETLAAEIAEGRLDGLIAGPAAIVRTVPGDALRHVALAGFGEPYAGSLVARRRWYAGLLEPVQAALRGGAEALAAAHRAARERDTAAALVLLKQRGAAVAMLPQETRAAWANALPNLAKAWAADLDRRGYFASRVLGAFLADLRDQGASITRDWAAD